KRSISLYGDKVIFATWNNFIVGLDARTGRRVWQSNRGGKLFVQNSSGPLVMKGVVVAGSTHPGAGFGGYFPGPHVTRGRGNLAQRDDSAAGSTRVRHLGWRAV